MKKKAKYPKVLFSKGLRLSFDPNLKPSPTTGDGFVARNLAAANEHLSKINNLEEFLKRHSSPE